jgi:cation diffusion facilitator family transporter
MNKANRQPWDHSHSFGQERRRPGEVRTLIVIAITATMMVVEIVAGIMFGSMALLADGLHMASHAVALGINAFAYVYARKHAHDPGFSFVTGKVNALGGFTGAILLAGFALMMAWESVDRLIFPVEIVFDSAILVAVLGLVVNGASVFILDHRHDERHDNQYDDSDGDHDHHDHGHHHDHNLRSAYLHVLADALTSLLAIFALLAAKYFGMVWMDPVMGIVGALLVARWSLGLIRATSSVLLDRQAPERQRRELIALFENDGETQVTDLHLWSVGPGIHSAIVSIVSDSPRPPQESKRMILAEHRIVHLTAEIHQRRDGV